MASEPQWLRDVLTELYALHWSKEQLPDFSEHQDKFVFHMVDAAAEIRCLAPLLQASEPPDPKVFAKLLHRFFLHAVPHLVAAGQLYDFVPHLFPEQNGVHSLGADSAPMPVLKSLGDVATQTGDSASVR